MCVWSETVCVYGVRVCIWSVLDSQNENKIVVVIVSFPQDDPSLQNVLSAGIISLIHRLAEIIS